VSGILLFHVTESAILAFVAAVLVGGLVAWVVGYLSIRIHGVYFAMITLAFAELFYNLLYRLDITGGSEGLFGFNVFFGVGGVGIYFRDLAGTYGPVQITSTSVYLYLALLLLVVSYFIMRRMLRSPFGTVLKSIRENEERATFLGYDTTIYKRRAFTVSGAFATVAGVLFAINSGFVSPGAAEWLKSGEVVVMVILGGMGTLYGPILGAFAFFGLESVITSFTRRWRLFLGLVFVLFVIFLPRGLISVPSQLAPYLPGGSGPEPSATPGPEADETASGGKS
jgi:branched-chain amino acid transport system permease protein